MISTYIIEKELLSYGFTWEQVEYYLRNPKELKELLNKLSKSEVQEK